MIPEIGHFALILALALACYSVCIVLAHHFSLCSITYASAIKALSSVSFFLITTAFVCLSYAFLTNDFSVSYVARHSNSLLPTRYKFASVWGGHEGSLLLWIWILSIWQLALALLSKTLPELLRIRVLAVISAVAAGFLLFILLTSNPFERFLPHFPADGQDLNPLLQDFGLIVHPPMLYMGYVGFAVAFAFAVAGLWNGELDRRWARWARPWVLTAWACLTLGIALGSWWAYYELGWGGWWFWDPVENASFMPWLVGTALVHSLIISDKRDGFKAWTVLLAILSFSLSLLGTFLVRSGVLTSVHAFANDPERGLFILIYLGLVIGGSLLLYAWRAQSLKTNTPFSWNSRESALLLNNIVLCIALSCVLIGTLYPLLGAAMGWRRVSIGAPYFNAFFVPLSLFILLLMGVAPKLRWREHKGLPKNSALILVLAIVSGAVIFLSLAAPFTLSLLLSLALSAWVILHLLSDILQKVRHSQRGFFHVILHMTGAYWGMYLAHFGFVVLVLGISLSSALSEERQVRMHAGERITLGSYHFELDSITQRNVENYQAHSSSFTVHNKEDSFRLVTEKRHYPVQNSVMTEAGIDAGFIRDVYISMGEAFADGSWSYSLQYKPFVRWIWMGALLIALGAVFAMFDKRYRRRESGEKSIKQTLRVEHE